MLFSDTKFRRRRAVMASLLTALARGMIFSHKDYHELARKRSRRKRERRGSHMCRFIISCSYSMINDCSAK